MARPVARPHALALALCMLAIAGPPRAGAGLTEVPPGDVGMDAARLALIEGALNRSIAAGQVPGAVAIVGRHGQIVYVKAVGKRSTVPAVEAMTRRHRLRYGQA